VGEESSNSVGGTVTEDPVGPVTGDDVSNASTGTVVLTGSVVVVNGGEDGGDAGAVLGTSGGSDVSVI